MSHKDPVCLAASLNFELNKLSAWFKANKLSLNLKKTNYMLFKPRQKRYHFPMQICINEQRIEQVKGTVFLGVVLDEHSSWKPHISQVARKISKSIGVINRARFFLPKPCLKTLYYCLVYPSLSSLLYYCLGIYVQNQSSPSWLCKSELSELFLNQLSILIQTLFSKNCRATKT